MALKKKLTFNNIEAEYWRVVGFNISLTGKLCQIFIVGYKDEGSRLQNLNIINRNYMIKHDNFDSYIVFDSEGNIVSRLYEFLKLETEDFKNVEDI